MTDMSDWDAWKADWQCESSRDQPRAIRSERQSGARLARGAIAIGGLLLLGGAITHAADVGEAVLAVLVAVGIATTWLAHAWGQREHDADASDAVSFLHTALRARRGQVKLARFVWTVLSLEAVFLVTWWAGGLRVHAHEALSLLAVGWLWGPLATMLGLAWWSVRLHRRASGELRELERLQREFQA